MSQFPGYKIKKVSDLIPYVNNSRTHSEEQITQVASSIKEFGFTNPVLIDSDGGIIAGHGRIMAAKKLNMDNVPCIELSNLTEAQKKAYIIADNQLALNSGWDLDMLKLEIEGLEELEFDIDLLGFDDDFMDGLLDVQTDEGITDEDEVPEAPEKPVSVLGDICYEPFTGSGTQIINCEKEDYIFHGMELSPEYIDIALMRWQNFTGKQAIHIESGKTYEELKNVTV